MKVHETNIERSVGGAILELLAQIRQRRVLQIVPQSSNESPVQLISQLGAIRKRDCQLDDFFDLRGDYYLRGNIAASQTYKVSPVVDETTFERRLAPVHDDL